MIFTYQIQRLRTKSFRKLKWVCRTAKEIFVRQNVKKCFQSLKKGDFSIGHKKKLFKFCLFFVHVKVEKSRFRILEDKGRHTFFLMVESLRGEGIEPQEPPGKNNKMDKKSPSKI